MCFCAYVNVFAYVYVTFFLPVCMRMLACVYVSVFACVFVSVFACVPMTQVPVEARGVRFPWSWSSADCERLMML